MMIAMTTCPNEVPRWFPDWKAAKSPATDRQHVDDGHDDAGNVAAAEQAARDREHDDAEEQDDDA